MSVSRATPAVRRLARALRQEAKAAAKEVASAVVRLADPGYEAPLREWQERNARAKNDLARALSRLMFASEFGGRVDLWFGADAPEPEDFAAAPSFVPQVEFEAAVRSLLDRDPFGAEELQRVGLEVSDLYAGIPQPDGEVFYPRGFAAALAVEREVAEKVRDRIAASLALGTPVAQTTAILAEEWAWPRSYAETVTRNAVNTAATAGRFVESERVRAFGIPVGFRFATVGDSDVRSGRPQDHGENHAALNGLVARADDPIWFAWSPPLGHRCRCTLEPIVGDDVPENFVQLPLGAAKAPGFGTRPDLRS